MKILAIESSGLSAAAAVWSEGEILAEYSMHHKKTHSQTLLPLIEAMLSLAEISTEEVDAIAISQGPGSFTGLRIGSATAKGLGLALDIPLIAVPTLDAMAYGMIPFCGLICPIVDARRNQVYTGTYRYSPREGLQVITPSRAVDIMQLTEELSAETGSLIFTGNATVVQAKKLQETMKIPYEVAPSFSSEPRAAALAELASLYYKEGKTTTAEAFAPDYLKPSQAERERAKKLAHSE